MLLYFHCLHEISHGYNHCELVAVKTATATIVRFTALDIRLQRDPRTKFVIPLFPKCPLI